MYDEHRNRVCTEAIYDTQNEAMLTAVDCGVFEQGYRILYGMIYFDNGYLAAPAGVEYRENLAFDAVEKELSEDYFACRWNTTLYLVHP